LGNQLSSELPEAGRLATSFNPRILTRPKTDDISREVTALAPIAPESRNDSQLTAATLTQPGRPLYRQLAGTVPAACE
jgi:hypothetical protein